MSKTSSKVRWPRGQRWWDFGPCHGRWPWRVEGHCWRVTLTRWRRGWRTSSSCDAPWRLTRGIHWRPSRRESDADCVPLFRNLHHPHTPSWSRKNPFSSSLRVSCQNNHFYFIYSQWTQSKQLVITGPPNNNVLLSGVCRRL